MQTPNEVEEHKPINIETKAIDLAAKTLMIFILDTKEKILKSLKESENFVAEYKESVYMHDNIDTEQLDDSMLDYCRARITPLFKKSVEFQKELLNCIFSKLADPSSNLDFVSFISKQNSIDENTLLHILAADSDVQVLRHCITLVENTNPEFDFTTLRNGLDETICQMAKNNGNDECFNFLLVEYFSEEHEEYNQSEHGFSGAASPKIFGASPAA